MRRQAKGFDPTTELAVWVLEDAHSFAAVNGAGFKRFPECVGLDAYFKCPLSSRHTIARRSRV